MATDRRKARKPGDKDKDFVPAVFARDSDDAQSYVALLKDHEIPAIVGAGQTPQESDQPEEAPAARRLTRGVPVLVPDALLDEASEIIADRENLSEYGLTEPEESDAEEDDENFGFTEELDDAEPAEDFDEEDDFLDDEDLDEEGEI